MKNVILLAVLLLFSCIGFSQTENSETKNKAKFGFNLGANYSNLQSKETLPDNVNLSNGVGFRMGMLMDYSISKNFLFSPKSELSFNNSSVEFTDLDNYKTAYDIFPVSFDLMIHLVYKTGNGKASPYFLFGPNFKLPLSKKSDSSSDYKTNPDFAIDFGVGLEKRTKYFVVAPEMRYSFGFLNVNENPALQTLNFHSVLLIFNFKK